MQVAGLVFELGGTQNEAIGGILHDVAEDAGGETALNQIQLYNITNFFINNG